MGHYEGEWKAGCYHGKGRITWGSTGSSYDGDWAYGKMQGRGVMRDAKDTVVSDGVWVHGQFRDREPTIQLHALRFETEPVEID